MSADDIIKIFEEFGILDTILEELALIFNIFSKEDLSWYLTYMPQENILERLLGKEHPLNKKFGLLLNERITAI